MAQVAVVLTDVAVTVNGVDLSGWVKSMTLNYNADVVDDTNMGDTTKISTGGLKTWDGTIEFSQDYHASAPDVTIFSLIGTTATVTGKPTSGANSTTNPQYSGTALFTGYEPLKGNVGQLALTTLKFTSAGTLSRLTA